MADYSFLDRVLHFAALQIVPIADLSFDLDQQRVKRDPREIVGAQHVFVSGLARAGTTILMRRFHATGAFRSLTYRDMPFVLAPNLWRQLSGVSQKAMEKSERAHGDGILVDFDSPESLDEVFWRIFAGEEYIAKSELRPHAPDGDVVERYVRYVNAILNSDDAGHTRYLSKNNNNILRLPAIRAAFPNALILVPLREPLAHAKSLLEQHRKFASAHKDDKFSTSYMTWLAHHEFGLDHRPFNFDGAPIPAEGRGQLDYWLHRWRDAYRWLERSAPADAVFVCYEDLCSDPGVWQRLASLAGLGEAGAAGEAFVLSPTAAEPVKDQAVLDEANAIYGRLRARSRASLA